MTLVTVSAAYGAGGSRIAPALAQRLGVPFLGRPPEPAAAAGRDEGEEARAGGEGLLGIAGGLLGRVASLAVSWGTPAGLTAEELLPDQRRRAELEQEVRAFAAGGRGVILGRGAVVVLRDHPGVLHVFLDGPREARIAQAMAIERIDRATAARRLDRIDRFRRAYVEDLYGVDVREPGVAHVVLDSTALGPAACVEVLAVAARLRGADRIRR
jgi:cytidylate kinase